MSGTTLQLTSGVTATKAPVPALLLANAGKHGFLAQVDSAMLIVINEYSIFYFIKWLDPLDTHVYAFGKSS